MRYYKIIEGDYLPSIGTGKTGGVEITKEEYDSIMSVIQTAPQEDGKFYRLKTDLTWEQYIPEEPEISEEEIMEGEKL